MKKICILICLLFLTGVASAQKLFFASSNYTDSAAFEKNIPQLAKQAIEKYHEADKESYLDNLFRMQIVAKAYDLVQNNLNQLAMIEWDDSTSHRAFGFPYALYSKVMSDMQNGKGDFTAIYLANFDNKYRSFNFDEKDFVNFYANTTLKTVKQGLDHKIKSLSGKDSLSLTDAVTLCRNYCSYLAYAAYIPLTKQLLIKIENETYIKSDSVLVKMPDGGTISLVIVRDRKVTAPQPVILRYNIYAGSEDIYLCKYAVHKGYVGITANTRGKRLSPDSIEPLEHDAKDAYYIIDWISKQPWCNGKVGMYGGSYLGFSQWSAVKYLHPALKTIVPQVAVGAGIDFPMQNGVYSSYALRWLHYVMDNKFTNENAFMDTAKWNALYRNWYKNGNSLRSLDTLEGRPNYIFQRWLNHPAYDSYWQQMTPQKEEFAKINIPIFTITGYWDDDQLGAMYYYRQYHKYNKNPNYYLLIGPYDHFGSQGNPLQVMEGYKIDSVANIVIDDIVFQWFDYILKGAPRPAILQDKVNFEVMGENKWRHVTSLDQMHNDTLTLYMGNTASNGQYPLLASKPQKQGYIAQTVNLADRSMIYPKGERIDAFASLVDSTFKPEKGKLVFISQPVDKPYVISGAFAADLLASINKKDMDLVVDLYEQTPDGKFMALNENLQRASFIEDRSQRHLLKPGKIEKIDIKNTYITSRLIEKGSRIIIILGINKYPEWQINYGTGKDVSDETMKDATIPMEIKWYNGSCIKLPVLR